MIPNGVDKTTVHRTRALRNLGCSVELWTPSRNAKTLSREEPEPGLIQHILPFGMGGLSAPRAMGAARPVLVTPATHLADEVADYDAGWVAAERREIDALRACLHASPEQLLVKGANARRLIEDRFQWSYLASKVLAGYRHYCP